ncbi:heavy metal-binding domain-containing protein [Lacibacterium aquatile]|uniref:UPF0145 protein ACFSM5_01210 n=1 Tax=Lacibacterium aquatile TaxID=1168082 RepID=A0ABW5DPM5_9PROT
MLLSTTSNLDGHKVTSYVGIVTGTAVMGVNVFKDFFASIRDIVGGRSGGYQNALKDARNAAFADLMDEARKVGANAVIGIDIDYEVLGKTNGMLMVSITGTAVTLG